MDSLQTFSDRMAVKSVVQSPWSGAGRTCRGADFEKAVAAKELPYRRKCILTEGLFQPEGLNGGFRRKRNGFCTVSLPFWTEKNR